MKAVPNSKALGPDDFPPGSQTPASTTWPRILSKFHRIILRIWNGGVVPQKGVEV